MAENSTTNAFEEARYTARLSFELIPDDAVVMSSAHSWAQALPLREHILVCIDCGYRRAIKANDAQICRTKAESVRSGFGGPVIRRSTGKQIGTIGRAGEWRVCQFLPS